MKKAQTEMKKSSGIGYKENVTSKKNDQISKRIWRKFNVLGKPTRNFWTSLSRRYCGVFSHFGFFGWKKIPLLDFRRICTFCAFSLGSNFMPLSELFIKFVPFYDKFRAPSSILVVVGNYCFPLIAIIGLYRFFNDFAQKKLSPEEIQTKNPNLCNWFCLGITLLLVILEKITLGFATSNETAYLPPYLLDYLVMNVSRCLE